MRQRVIFIVIVAGMVLSCLLILIRDDDSGIASEYGEDAYRLREDASLRKSVHALSGSRKERLVKQFASFQSYDSQARRAVAILRVLEGMQADDFPELMPEVSGLFDSYEYATLIVRWTALAPSDAFDFVVSGQSRPLHYHGVPPDWHLSHNAGMGRHAHQQICIAYFCDDLDSKSQFYRNCHRYNGGLYYIIKRWAAADLQAAAGKVDAFRESLGRKHGVEGFKDTGKVIRKLWDEGEQNAFEIDMLIANARLHSAVSLAAFEAGQSDLAMRMFKQVDPKLQHLILYQGPLGKLMPGMLLRSSSGPNGQAMIRYTPMTDEHVEGETRATQAWINALPDDEVRCEAVLAALPIIADMNQGGCLAWISGMKDQIQKRKAAEKLAELWAGDGETNHKPEWIEWTMQLPSQLDSEDAVRFLNQFRYSEKK